MVIAESLCAFLRADSLWGTDEAVRSVFLFPYSSPRISNFVGTRTFSNDNHIKRKKQWCSRAWSPCSRFLFGYLSSWYDFCHWSSFYHACSCSASGCFFWLIIARGVSTSFIMASQPSPPNLLRSRRPECSSTSSHDVAASSIFLFPSAPFHFPSNRPFRPPSLTSVLPRPFSISPITRPVIP